MFRWLGCSVKFFSLWALGLKKSKCWSVSKLGVFFGPILIRSVFYNRNRSWFVFWVIFGKDMASTSGTGLGGGGSDSDVVGFMCDVCGKYLQSRGGLRTHVSAVHNNLKPWRCEYCERGFSQKSNLDRHIRIKLGETQLRCEFCWKLFSTKVNFYQHMRSHIRERPEECCTCGSEFGTKTHLKRHVERKHK